MSAGLARSVGVALRAGTDSTRPTRHNLQHSVTQAVANRVVSGFCFAMLAPLGTLSGTRLLCSSLKQTTSYHDASTRVDGSSIGRSPACSRSESRTAARGHFACVFAS